MQLQIPMPLKKILKCFHRILIKKLLVRSNDNINQFLEGGGSLQITKIDHIGRGVWRNTKVSMLYLEQPVNESESVLVTLSSHLNRFSVVLHGVSYYNYQGRTLYKNHNKPLYRKQ